MSNSSKLRELETAKNSSFKTYLYFICTDDFHKNIDRVKLRVAKGGHDVDISKIEKRHFKTLENLSDAIKIVDRAFLFDNSGKKMDLLAEVYKGQAIKFHTSVLPLWFEEYVYNKFELYFFFGTPLNCVHKRTIKKNNHVRYLRSYKNRKNIPLPIMYIY